MSNPNPSPDTRFKKGDPRINRKGKPKSFDALRALAQEIAHEPLQTKDGQPLLVNGKRITATEFILRKWVASNDPRQQQAFIEIAYGKTPSVIEGRDGKAVQVDVHSDAIDKLFGKLLPELTAGDETEAAEELKQVGS